MTYQTADGQERFVACKDEISLNCHLYELFKQFKINMTLAETETFAAQLEGFAVIRDGVSKLRDYLVEEALFRSALDGDVRAQLSWLTKRLPDEWK